MADMLATGQASDLEKVAIPSTDISNAPTVSNTRANSDIDIESSSAVKFRYLTFDMEVPSPNPVSIKGPSEQLPPAPDLRAHQNPQEWHWLRKAAAVGTSTFGCLLVAYASASYAFAVPDISREFNVSTTVANIGITIFNVGFGITPMLCAPLSESVGRYPVFVISGVLFVITQLCCTVTPTFAGMLISRFLVGCGGSTFSTIVGGVVSDLFVAQDRNTPMAVFSSSTMIGVGTGLSISGAIVQHNDWRWLFGVQTICSAAAVIAVALLLKETRGNVVLRRRAEALNKYYDRLEDKGFFGVEIQRTPKEQCDNLVKRYELIRWKVEADDKRPRMLQLVGISLVRPFSMLCTEPVVFFFSCWAMFAWSILYLTFESIPLMMTASYGFSDYQNGLVFLAMVAAVFIVLPACIAWDKVQRRNTNSKLSSTPEGRLTFVCFLSAFMPIGLFWIGWSANGNIPWIVPTLGLGCLTIGIFTIYLAVFNYFADVYGFYASSAMAAQSFCRNFLSSVFPFFSNIMFIRLGFGPAASLLGGIGLILMMAPILLLINGAKIRGRSNYISV